MTNRVIVNLDSDGKFSVELHGVNRFEAPTLLRAAAALAEKTALAEAVENQSKPT